MQPEGVREKEDSHGLYFLQSALPHCFLDQGAKTAHPCRLEAAYQRKRTNEKKRKAA